MPLDSSDTGREAPKAMGSGSKWASWGGSALGLIILALAVWAFGKILRRYDLHEVMAEVGALPGIRLAMALIFTGLSYLIQTGYDYLAVRSLNRGVSFARASFAAWALYPKVGKDRLLPWLERHYRLAQAIRRTALTTCAKPP